MATKRYVRIWVQEINGAAGPIGAIQELQLIDDQGNNLLNSSMPITASLENPQYGEVATNLIDGQTSSGSPWSFNLDPANTFATIDTGGGLPDFQFVRMWPQFWDSNQSESVKRCPTSFLVADSDDQIVWRTLASYTGQTSIWSYGFSSTFAVNNVHQGETRPAEPIVIDTTNALSANATVYELDDHNTTSIGQNAFPYTIQNGAWADSTGITCTGGDSTGSGVNLGNHAEFQTPVWTRVITFDMPNVLLQSPRNGLALITSAFNQDGALGVYIDKSGTVCVDAWNQGRVVTGTHKPEYGATHTLAIGFDGTSVGISLDGQIIGSGTHGAFVNGTEFLGFFGNSFNWDAFRVRQYQFFPANLSIADLNSISANPEQTITTSNGTGGGTGGGGGTSAGPIPSSWQFLGSEGNTVGPVDAGALVRWGVTKNGVDHYVTKTITAGGSFPATNEYFGSDPSPGDTKHVDWYKPMSKATQLQFSGSTFLPIGSDGQPWTFSLDGYLDNTMDVTLSCPGVTLTPSTFTFDNSHLSFQVIPHAAAAVSSTLHIAETGTDVVSVAPDQTVTASNGIVYEVGTVAELQDAFAQARQVNCIAIQQNVYIRATADINLTGSSAWMESPVNGANDMYHVIFEPKAGLSFKDFDGAGPIGYGAQGIELTLGSDNALEMKNGLEVRGFRINITANHALKATGAQGYWPRLYQNKIKVNADGGINIVAYQVLKIEKCLLLRDVACGGQFVDGAWCLYARGNTVAVVGAGTVTNALGGGWGNQSELSDNVFWNAGSPPYSGGFNRFNNLSNQTMSDATGFVVDTTSQFFQDVNGGNFRPAGPALGSSTDNWKSQNDLEGKNQGLDPDMGAIQAVPSVDLATPTVTSQSFDPATGIITISGTHTGNADNGAVYVDPLYHSRAGTPRQGPFVLTIDNGNHTWTAQVQLGARDLYDYPVITMSNAGGTGPTARGAIQQVLNYDIVPQDLMPGPSVIQPIYWQTPGTSTDLNKKVDHMRKDGSGNWQVIATYTELGDLLSKDARYGTPQQQVLPGDEIWVYPALYRKSVWFGGFAGAKLEGVTVKGITQNGVRPVIAWDGVGSAYGYGTGYGSGNGIVYVQDNKNCVWDNIDIMYDGGYLGKALVYIYCWDDANITFRNCRIMGSFRQGQNGTLSAHGSYCSLTFENVESGFQGGNGGPPPAGGGASLAHGFYITRHEIQTPLMHWKGCFFHNTWQGHLLKCRHNNALVEGCYFMGSTPEALNDPAMPDKWRTQVDVSEASCMDMPNGGTVTLRNNIFTKSWTGPEEGIFCFNWAAETDGVHIGEGGEYDPSGTVHIHNNTFVAYSNEGTKYNTGTIGLTVPLNFWGSTGGGNPDGPTWPFNSAIPISIHDNVYAGFTSDGFYEHDATKVGINDINLPGRDNAVPFSLKTPVPSLLPENGKGYPHYVHRATWVNRTDTNKGAVGTLEANINPTGNPAQPMMTPVSSGRPGYPLQYEWTNVSGAVAVDATTLSINAPASGTVEIETTITVTTDQALHDAQSLTVHLDDGAGGTFVPNDFVRNPSTLAATSVKYTPHGTAGNRTITASATGTPTVTNGTKVYNATAPVVTDTTPPTVSVTASPQNVTQSGQVIIEATASDPSGIAKVEISKGGTVLATLTAAPYKFTDNVTSAQNGTQNYSAKAYDGVGNTATATVAVTVAIPITQSRSISLPLTSDGATPIADMTGLKYCWWDKATPDLFTAPLIKGNNGSIVGGKFNLTLAGSALAVGGIGCLLLTNSDGTPTQNPPALVFFGPVSVS